MKCRSHRAVIAVLSVFIVGGVLVEARAKTGGDLGSVQEPGDAAKASGKTGGLATGASEAPPAGHPAVPPPPADPKTAAGGQDPGTKEKATSPSPLVVWLISAMFIAPGFALLILPFLSYTWVGWEAKRKDIMDGLNADSRLAYFEMFSRADARPAANNAMREFEKLYGRWYGRKYFVFPGALLGIVGLIAVGLLTMTGLHRMHYIADSLLFDVPDTAMAAIAGAYLWVVNDLISRARRLDFSPANVLWAALRLIVSVPMGYAFASIASKSTGPFVAFALGAFPLTALMAMLSRLANKNLGIEPTQQEKSDNIVNLQGINRSIADRLADEDVTTITQIAYCDPVRLVMRSNLSFNFVTDCMNQALAWIYFDDDLAKQLRPLGVRGAVEIRSLIDDYDKTSQEPAVKAAHERAVAALPVIAAKLGQDPATLQVAFRQIAYDPFTIFLQRVWT